MFFVVPGVVVFLGTSVILDYYSREVFWEKRYGVTSTQVFGFLVMFFSQVY